MKNTTLNIETLSIKGTGNWNEDAIVQNESAHLYGVLDGVSSRVPYRNENDQTGGYLAANIVKKYFESLEQVNDLKNHVEHANNQLATEMKKANIDLDDKNGLWGTALALIHFTDEGIEYVQTGDCMIFVVYENNTVRTLTHPQVAHLEEIELDVWRDGIKNGIPKEELVATVRTMLRKNRLTCNTDEGYGVLNGETYAVNFLEYGKINSIKVKYLVLLTDGLFLPSNIQPETCDLWHEMVVQLLSKGMNQYAQELIDLEESDPECEQYLRFKKSDDKTGMVIRF